MQILHFSIRCESSNYKGACKIFVSQEKNVNHNHYVFLWHSLTIKAMKKLLYFLLIMCCVSVSFASAQDGGGDDPINILIRESGSGEGSPSHHAPALIPIQATFYPSLSTISVYFQTDLGDVTVAIENQTTGEYNETVIDSGDGILPFLISGTSGHWYIFFTLFDGMAYFGDFHIFL